MRTGWSRASAATPSASGFSSDLFIIHVNSVSAKHDGPQGSFYQSLKSGQPYTGYYAAPLNEIAELFQELRAGKPIRTG